MSNYKYKNPIDEGYKEIKLSHKQHAELLPNRKQNILIKYRYYIKENSFYLERYISVFGKIVITIILPFSFLINISGIREIWHEYKSILFQRKYGSFTSDIIYSQSFISKIKRLTRRIEE